MADTAWMVQALTESKFKRLVEVVPAAAYTCDASGLITSYNARACEAWGRSPKLNDPEDRYCGSFRMFSPEGVPIPHSECCMALALRENREYNNYEVVIERPDGTRRTVLAHANPFNDEWGNLTGAVNIMIDISDRKLLEVELREADRHKNEFLAVLAHELRNPLAPIRNVLHLLKQHESSPAIAMAHDVIERQVQQMTRLVDDLMDVSRITQNRLVLKKERADLAAILESAMDATRPVIEERGHELSVALPEPPIHLDADLTRMAQVFSNLLTNAAKFMDRGGHIWITARRSDREVTVSVRDAGIGIANDMLCRVFEPFVQVDRSIDQAQGGLGIGLSLVRRLVEMHGGAVEARSAGPGRGSEFIVRMPVLDHSPVHTLEEKGMDEPIVNDHKSRILVVDDNKDSALSLAMVLEFMGHETRTAYDGIEAVEAVEEMKPEVVLLDIGLPRMNGYDAARKIRALPGGDAIFLIALTGWGQDEDRRRSADSGFNLHMVKPVDPVAIENLLAGLKRPTA